MATHVNLDAMLRREDFEVVGETLPPAELAQGIKVSEIEPSSMTLQTLRKPDFQRETSNWSPEKVANFIQSFLVGNLVPAIILWRSDKSGNVFVIDGAHRLSALVAWAHDDYGDNIMSRKFFDNYIPQDQEKAAALTRKLVNESVGSYAELKLALINQETSRPEKIRLAKNLSVFAIKLQWVVGDAEKAEKSFFTINMQATPINNTELRMIEDRHKPNALAARALIRSGTGHKYWSTFPVEMQDKIEEIAREVYKMLFAPDLETPIKTLDLPVAGQGYSAESAKLIFDFVDFANRNKRKTMSVVVESGGKTKTISVLAEDIDGQETVNYLTTVRKLISLVTGTYAGSLGLHPAVYYYSATGRYQPTAFLATINFMEELERNKKLPNFTRHRANFEEFILKYKYFINQIVQKRGSDERGLAPIVDMYRIVFQGISQGLDDSQVIKTLMEDPRLKVLLREITDEDRKHGRNFSADTKSAAYLRDAIEKAVRCSICNARVHKNSISIDHKVRRQDGGDGSLDNANLTHPYCNTGYKEAEHSQRLVTASKQQETLFQ